jgi:uncharacterized protein (DUF1697 family)
VIGMPEYVAFLRGINVGGIRIKMNDLAKAFGELGFADVRTVLASGNVLFSTKRASKSTLKKKIERALGDTFGYEAWIVLLDATELRAVIDAFPFDEHDATMQPYVVLASDPAPLAELSRSSDELVADEERIRPGAGVLYWQVRRGRSVESKFAKQSSKPRYKATTTVRNLRTLRKIAALLGR